MEHDPARNPRVGAPAAAPGHRPDVWLWPCVGLAGSLLLRLSLFDFESGDYRFFLSRWYDLYVEQGRWRGLGLEEPFATYPPLYLYLLSASTLLPLPKLYAVKVLSVTVDYVGAWYVWRLARRHSASDRTAWVAGAAFLFLPTVVMNGALWGQCDVMYTAGFLASLFYLVERKPVAALAAFGVSCALKPQAIFWCPLLAGLFVAGRLPWRWCWLPGAVYVGLALPAIAAGRPLAVALWPGGLSGSDPTLTLGATNWYQWVFAVHSDVLWWVGIGWTLLATEVFVWRTREGPPAHLTESQWVVSLALLSVLFPPSLLPGMHERYFFAADVLSVVYAVYVSGGYRVTVLMQLASGFTYLPYLFEWEPVPRWLLSFAVVGALGMVVGRLRGPRPKPQVQCISSKVR